MKKIYRELKREFPDSKIETANGGHLRICLPNGRKVYAAATPSCPYFMQHVRSDVKRAMRTNRTGRMSA
jgi:hypothetical protein